MITLSDLQSWSGQPVTPATAPEICFRLGGLARWWLHRTVLHIAHATDPNFPAYTDPALPQLSDQLGSCWIICQTRCDLEGLKPAVVLPLQWRMGLSHSTWLTPKCRELADRVLDQVREITQDKTNLETRHLPTLDGQRWGLHPAAGVASAANQLADDVFESLESAWAALTAGLITAIQGLNPRTDVWASAAWGPLGVSKVEGLKEKLATAAEWGASEFFVPVWQVESAQEIVAEMVEDLTIHPLGMPFPPDAYQSLRGYLAEFSAQPTPPASYDDEEGFERCRQFYLNQSGWNKATTQFYESHLLRPILQRCQKLIITQYPEFHARHLISIVSGSPELTIMAAVATGVTCCLLLHTADYVDKAKLCREELVNKYNFASERITLVDLGDFRSAAEAIAGAVRPYTNARAAEEFVVNGKSGTSKMVIMLVTSAPAGAWVYNVDARMLPDRRNDPATLVPEVYRLVS